MDIAYFSTVLSLLADRTIDVTALEAIPGGYGSPRVDRIRLARPFCGHSSVVAKYVPAGAGGEVSAYRWFVSPFVGEEFGPLAMVHAEEGGWWIFLPDFGDETLDTTSAPAAWREAARWIARFQAAPLPSLPARLPRGERFLSWSRRGIVRRLREGGRRLERFEKIVDLPGGETMVRRWGNRAAFLRTVLPRVPGGFERPLHGDYKGKNLLVDRSAGDVRIHPVDWANAGFGPLFLDIHTLARDLPPGEREDVVGAFFDERTDVGSTLLSRDEVSLGMAIVALMNSLLSIVVLADYLERGVDETGTPFTLARRFEEMEGAFAAAAAL